MLFYRKIALKSIIVALILYFELINSLPISQITQIVNPSNAEFFTSMQYQKDNNLNVTTTSKVKKLTSVPSTSASLKNYPIEKLKESSVWPEKALTYKIHRYPEVLERDQVKTEIERAFAVWSEYTDLTFTPKETDPVHINIRFVKGVHGDDDPFDGIDGAVAHAFLPNNSNYAGEVHFDNDEVWTANSTRGTNLFYVAAHEFGHALGMKHSNVSSALMAVKYRDYDPLLKLHFDDIQVIQALYGKKAHAVGICADVKIHALLKSIQDEPCANYCRLEKNFISKALGLSENIDVGFTNKDGKIYIFKSNQYWRYSECQLDNGYPKFFYNLIDEDALLHSEVKEYLREGANKTDK